MIWESGSYFKQRNAKMIKTMKKTVWIVKKDAIEITRVKTKQNAERIVELINKGGECRGTYHAYTVEWVA
jgi:hypothetical protein